MKRYKLVLSYDGYNYFGFQIQNDLPTIQLELLKAFKKLLKIDVQIYASGRTDRYVHAYGQVVHVDLDVNIMEYGLKKGLNSFLPDDIYIKEVAIVNEDFHARFSAVKKEYRYYINIKEPNPLTCRYAPFINKLDEEKMQESFNYLLGEHDFKAFASAQIDPRKSTVRTIEEIKLINHKDEYLEFIFIGNSFLKYQIRRMMGIIVEVGKGHFKPEKIKEILDSKDPSQSKYILDGKGLYLYSVSY